MPVLADEKQANTILPLTYNFLPLTYNLLPHTPLFDTNY